MNDFTKDELLTIQDLIIWEDDDPEPQSERIEMVKAKIQSLIDNYCEHESDGYCYYKGGIKCTDFLTYASSDSSCLLKCVKCSQLFDDGRP